MTEARPAAGGDGATEAVRRRSVDQCRIVEPGGRLAGARGAERERAALERSQARSRAAQERDAREANRDESQQSRVEREGSPSQRERSRAESSTSGDEGEGRREATRRGRYYSAARTLDLELGVVVRRDVSPSARVELRLLTPRGHLYQTLRLAAAPEARSSRSAVKPASSRERTSPRAQPGALTAALPVAGTAIVNHSLYGEWTAEPRLDGEPCGVPVRFWIGE